MDCIHTEQGWVQLPGMEQGPAQAQQEKSAGEHVLGYTWFKKFPSGNAAHWGRFPGWSCREVHVHCLHPAQGGQITSQAGACLGNL